jgi:hypothetical protein
VKKLLKKMQCDIVNNNMKLLKWHKREIALRQCLRGGESGGNK